MEQGFAVVLIAGLTVFGLSFIASDGDFSTSEDEEEMIIFEENIGTVGDITEDTRTVELGSFTVGEGRSDIQAYREDEATITRGLFSGESLNFDYEASQPREGTLDLRVIGREGSGAIYLDVNGERVFEEPMTSDFSGEGETIEISEDELKTGDNDFELGTTKGGLLTSTEYKLEDIELEVDDRDYHKRNEDFRMYTHEFDNLRGAELDFRIPLDGSVPGSPLEILVNGNTVSEETRGQGEYTVELDEEADLKPGQNSLDITTSGEAGELYEIENANLQIDYAVTSEPESTTQRINLTQEELDFTDREDTSEELRFDYTNRNRPNEIQIDFNDETFDLTPENGENTVELDEGLVEEENILTVSSEGSYRMENLQLASRVEEE